LVIGERIPAGYQSTAPNGLQSAVPLNGKLGFDSDHVVLARMRVGDGDVAVIDVFNFEWAMMEVKHPWNTGCEIGDHGSADIENLGTKDNGSHPPPNSLPNRRLENRRCSYSPWCKIGTGGRGGFGLVCNNRNDRKN